MMKPIPTALINCRYSFWEGFVHFWTKRAPSLTNSTGASVIFSMSAMFVVMCGVWWLVKRLFSRRVFTLTSTSKSTLTPTPTLTLTLLRYSEKVHVGPRALPASIGVFCSSTLLLSYSLFLFHSLHKILS